MASSRTTCVLPVRDYDLNATLDCGQAFRWTPRDDGAWEGVIGPRWVRLRARDSALEAETAMPAEDWSWLVHHLQTDVDLGSILRTFPEDAAMRASVAACRGLRLLRQDPWECLASFILSSTKQIVQIRQIIDLLCRRFGEPVAVPPGHEPVHAFPTAARLAAAEEPELRACKMGFRAPNLLATARRIAGGGLELGTLHAREAGDARAALVELPGVGRKIADCVLLFSCGFQRAFPLDVWILRALREIYFPKRRPTRPRLTEFVESYFGPYGGYAQQYLFHYMRTRPRQGGKARTPRRKGR